MFNKKNFPLILGFSIPLLMILFIVVSIYIPGLFLHPKYNFIYSTSGDYYSSQYSVREGRLVENPQPTPKYPDYRQYDKPDLYIHDVKTNESRSISFQDAAQFKLDPNLESEDGYKLENAGSGGGFFPFGGYNRDYGAKYLVGHNVSKKLNVKVVNSSYYNSIHFLGWVIQ